MNEWRELAACRGMDPEVFLPAGPAQARRAIKVCATCPVTAECLEHAFECGEIGVWGGTTFQERKRMRPWEPKSRRCEWCTRTFLPSRASGGTQVTCSPLCRKLHRRLKLRGYKRVSSPEVTGVMLDAGHGAISRYMAGCHCSACRAVARERRARIRTAASLAAEDVA